MTEYSIESRIREIFAEELAIDDDEVMPDLAYGDIAEWDSIAHVHLVAVYEDEFQITLEDDEIARLSPYSSLVQTISMKAMRNG